MAGSVAHKRFDLAIEHQEGRRVALALGKENLAWPIPPGRAGGETARGGDLALGQDWKYLVAAAIDQTHGFTSQGPDDAMHIQTTGERMQPESCDSGALWTLNYKV
jgi:hypothetical protein